MMRAAGTDTKSLINAWRKTNEQELSNSLKIEYGFSPALARSLVQLMHEHIESIDESGFAPKTMKTAATDRSIDMGSEGC